MTKTATKPLQSSGSRPEQPWSVYELARVIGQSWHTTRRALEGLAPDGEIRGKPAWTPQRAIPHLARTLFAKRDADGFTPRERRDHVEAERSLIKLKAERGELLDKVEVEQEFARVFEIIDRELGLFPDQLERDTGLPPKAIEQADLMVDRIREQLYEKLTENAGDG